MKRILSLVLISISLFGFDTVLPNTEQVKLRIKSEVGDEQNLKLTSKLSTSGIEMDMHMYLNKVTKATNIDHSLFDLESEFQRIVMNMKGLGMDLTYDSDKPIGDKDPVLANIASGLEPFIGAKVVIQVNDFGKVLSIDFGENQRLFEQQTFDMKQTHIPFPEEAIALGSEWGEEKEIDGINTTITYKVVDITEEDVNIDVTGSMLSEEIMEGSITGKYVINRATGFVTTAEMLTKMTSEGQTIDVQMHLETVE